MKKFSTNWKSSKRPKKQRKYVAKLPLHLKKKLLSVNLSKELRKKYKKRHLPIRKGDTVKIMKGKFAKKQGKILKVNKKLGKIYIEGIQVAKIDGSKIDCPLKASNLQLIELNLEDRKRNKNLKQEAKKDPKDIKEEEKK